MPFAKNLCFQDSAIVFVPVARRCAARSGFCVNLISVHKLQHEIIPFGISDILLKYNYPEA